jgi:hypothetical protein
MKIIYPHIIENCNGEKLTFKSRSILSVTRYFGKIILRTRKYLLTCDWPLNVQS